MLRVNNINIDELYRMGTTSSKKIIENKNEQPGIIPAVHFCML